MQVLRMRDKLSRRGIKRKKSYIYGPLTLTSNGSPVAKGHTPISSRKGGAKMQGDNLPDSYNGITGSL